MRMNLSFDNASTSYPKPQCVGRAMSSWLEDCGGTYGRAAYGRVVDSVAIVEDCRDRLAQLVGAPLAENLFFTLNATYGANAVISGLKLSPADRVLVSALEHNAIMRPLVNSSAEYLILPSLADGRVDVERLPEFDTHGVKLVIINHISNVNGVEQPMALVGAWAKSRGLPLMVDVSQSLGIRDVDVQAWMADYLIFTGHKALLGPMGVGGFWARDPQSLSPFVYGGTGSNSDSFDMPLHYPDRMEAGTPNIVGLVGLNAALDERKKIVIAHNSDDYLSLVARVRKIDGIRVFSGSAPLFSLVSDRLSPSAIAQGLYDRFGIEVRSGLHCAPMAHRNLGTYPEGSVRISPSVFHSATDFEYLAQAIEAVCM